MYDNDFINFTKKLAFLTLFVCGAVGYWVDVFIPAMAGLR